MEYVHSARRSDLHQARQGALPLLESGPCLGVESDDVLPADVLHPRFDLGRSRHHVHLALVPPYGQRGELFPGDGAGDHRAGDSSATVRFAAAMGRFASDLAAESSEAWSRIATA